VRVVALALLLFVFPAAARAAACPGADPCPYGAYAAFSQNGGGVFRQPQAVAVSPSGEVYVADRWSYLVQHFSSSGAFLGEFGEYGSGPGQFGAIGGLALDSSGNVYALDTDHNRVEKFAADGTFIRQFGSSVLNIGWKGGIAVSDDTVYVSNSDQEEIARFTLDGTALTPIGGSAGFAHPLGLAVSGSHLFVADDQNDRVVELNTSDGSYVAASSGSLKNAYDVGVDGAGNVWVANNGGNNVVKFSSDFAGATSYPGAGINTPRALAVNADGDVYVADTLNERVQELDPEGNVLAVFGVNGRNFGSLTGPEGLALAPDGHLVIADTLEYAMQELDPNGAFLRRWGNHNEFQLESDAAVDPSGNIYVADTGHDEVQKWDAALSAGTVIGQGQLAAPQGVAVDPAGNVYVADTGNNRIAKFDPTGNLVASWGGFNLPADVEYWAPVLYVVEAGGDRVDELSPDGSVLARWGGSGGGAGQFNAPEGIGVDSSGRVYVADSGNARVQRFGPTGAFLDSWGGYGHADGQFVAPADVVVGANGDAFVSDTFNNRLERFSFGPATAPPPPPPPPPAAPAARSRLPAPRLKLKVARRQRALRQHGVKVTVSCASNCRTVVTATVSIPKAARTLRLRTVTIILHAKHTAHRKLRLTKAATRRTRAALRKHRRVTILVTATARAPAGPSAATRHRTRIRVTG
jgi:tripartite motif-containing protein 71